jgi:hypothetical protein
MALLNPTTHISLIDTRGFTDPKNTVRNGSIAGGWRLRFYNDELQLKVNVLSFKGKKSATTADYGQSCRQLAPGQSLYPVLGTTWKQLLLMYYKPSFNCSAFSSF